MKQQNFKIVSLLTVFTVALNVLSAAVLLQPVKAATTISDSMSSMTASAAGVTHTITWTGGTGDVVLTLPAGFTAVTTGTTCTAAAQVVTCTASGGTFTATNPETTGSYMITYVQGADNGNVDVAIVDSDTVNVNGYINTSITFDLDTGALAADCASNACLAYTGGTAASNYTVDLGNLVAGVENTSGDSVLHSDGGSGAVNYIGFDLSSNAANGVVVTYASANGRLDGPGANEYDIPSVSDGATFSALAAAHSNGYGIAFANDPTNVSNYINLGSGGTITPKAACTMASGTICGVTTGAQTLLAVSTSVQGLRGELSVGALTNGTNPAGTYNDTLTFIATATY